MQEHIPVQPAVHEGRIQPSHNILHCPLVDVSEHGLLALELELGEHAVLDHGHAGLPVAHTYYDLLAHPMTSYLRVRRASGPISHR